MVSRKEKKKAQVKKNRFQQEIFNFIRLKRQEEDRVQDMKEAKKPSHDEGEENAIWSAKVGEIRNRLTGQKRSSKERWNRFAGTGGEGGRGL